MDVQKDPSVLNDSPISNVKHTVEEDGDNSESCPIPASGSSKTSQPGSIDFGTFSNNVSNLCQEYSIENLDNIKTGLSDKVKQAFKNFFDGLANFGKPANGDFEASVTTGVVNIAGGIIPTVGMNAMLSSSVQTICAQVARKFESTSEEVARTVFSGFSIFSAGIRSALPMLGEMVRQAKNPEEIFIVAVASAVMASVYLATSAISTLLAGHHAILNSPTTAEMAAKVLRERGGVKSSAPNFSEIAEASLEKISRMLKTWKKNVSANFLALAKEVLLLGGAAVSCFAALAKFAPVLAVPFVSIISGSISLVANVLETAQGIVERSRLNSELKELRQRLEGGDNSPELNKQIQNLERLLDLSMIRIIKGGLNILLSIGSIVLGVLPLLMSFSMPILPAILGTVSLASVVVLGIAGLVVRKMNNAGSVSKDGVMEENSDGESTRETDSDDDRDNVPGYRSTGKIGDSSVTQKSVCSSDSSVAEFA